jgi:predicted ribosome quality control (RQC) complex YloA/Tae2 family protein
MQTQTQTKLEEKLKELRRQNRKLANEILEMKAKLEKYRQDNDILTRRVTLLEDIVLDLIRTHYGDKVRVSFATLELCVDQKCVRFGEYEELLIALRILPLLAQ